jgi:hypothetical protein
MDKINKPSDSGCYTQYSEPFKFYYYLILVHLQDYLVFEDDLNHKEIILATLGQHEKSQNCF